MATVTTSQVQPPVAPPAVLAMSPDQVAQALGITRTKTYKLLASGAILSVKIGKYRRIPIWEVEAYLRREIEARSA